VTGRIWNSVQKSLPYDSRVYIQKHQDCRIIYLRICLMRTKTLMPLRDCDDREKPQAATFPAEHSHISVSTSSNYAAFLQLSFTLTSTPYRHFDLHTQSCPCWRSPEPGECLTDFKHIRRYKPIKSKNFSIQFPCPL